jgi:hypothetical protein
MPMCKNEMVTVLDFNVWTLIVIGMLLKQY